MAQDQTRRIRPEVLDEDRDALDALSAISGYNPANAAYTLANGNSKRTAMFNKQATEVQKKGEFDAARDEAAASEWDFHNWVLGAKAQVKAQFGDDSNEWQSLGMIKKSERRRPSSPSEAPQPPSP